MAQVQQSIDVNVPVHVAYNQWTQFEEFPKFMEGVKEVRQIDDTTLEWHASINGQDETWTAEISEQEPDQRIAWHATSGRQNGGVVTFHRLDPQTTRVTLQMEWQPEGAVENVGAGMGFDDRQVKADLERFRDFIESRGDATGAWRGRVEQGANH